MKKTPSDIKSSNLWETILTLQEGESVDLNNFPAEEQIEIQESLDIIKAIKTSQEGLPVPPKTAFNEMLINLPQKEATTEKNWKQFLSKFHINTKQWVAIPVLGLLAFTVISWHQESVVQVVAAKNLSEEIQNDFSEISRDIEEIELLKKELNLVYLEEEKPLYL